MARFNSPLDNIRVASPCSSDWNQMIGDERVRFCRECSLNVYNLSGMTRSEAESIIANAEGRLCVRYYRRRDGTILTKNCPVGLRAIKRRISRTASAMLSAVLGFFVGLGVYAGSTYNDEPSAYIDTVGVVAVPEKEISMGQPQVVGSIAVPIVGRLPADRYTRGRRLSKKAPR
jgi:hypothetical protein